MIKIFFVALLLSTSIQTFANNHSQADITSIKQALDTFHQAAADANAKVYLSLLADDAVFLGTDATERWSKQEFSQFVLPKFRKGSGWLYTPVSRHISLIKPQTGVNHIAYFDELLDNENYGRCRGTGVLIKTKQGWKITQYSLSVPLPNAIAKELIQTIQEFEDVSNDK